jgi:hypothetical protein
MKLMHCPFCGESEDLNVVADFSNNEVTAGARFQSFVFFVTCGRCVAEGPSAESTDKAVAKESAINDWNNRLSHSDDLALRTAYALGA